MTGAGQTVKTSSFLSATILCTGGRKKDSPHNILSVHCLDVYSISNYWLSKRTWLVCTDSVNGPVSFPVCCNEALTHRSHKTDGRKRTKL